MVDDRPNLLLIQADQLKPHMLSFHGGEAITPHLDQLAANGVVFDNAYCNFPLCAPSRFSMLCGLLPTRIAAYDNAAEFPASEPTIAHYLRLAGYHTVLAGKQHFVGPDMLHGFHRRLLPELYPTDFNWTPDWAHVRMENNNDSSSVTQAGVCVRSLQMDHDETVSARTDALLHDLARSSMEQPFFLSISFTHPHEPYFTTQTWWDLYRHDDVSMPDTGLLEQREHDPQSLRILEMYQLNDGSIEEHHIRTARHSYLANVSYFDHLVGKILSTLAATGLAQNTIILLTSDHGDMLGERGLWFKKHFYDHSARVPLLCYAPGRFAASRNASNVSLLDVLPTLCELAGLAVDEHAPRELDGHSLVALCDDASQRRNEAVLAEMTCEGIPSSMFMVKHGDLKLITGGDGPDLLFDLEKDKHERVSVADDPAYRENLSRLRAQAARQWDGPTLDAQIRLSHRRRRLVQSAHGQGAAPIWEHDVSDPALRFCLRGRDNYNDWAWRGIKGVG